jgi:hypothetical protein
MIFLVVLAYQPRRQGCAGKERFPVAGDGNGIAEAHQWRCIDGPPAGGKGQARVNGRHGRAEARPSE